jgi:hypothetical protein
MRSDDHRLTAGLRERSGEETRRSNRGEVAEQDIEQFAQAHSSETGVHNLTSRSETERETG